MNLQPDNLMYHSGSKDFTKEEFLELITPYLPQLEAAGRTNFLCAFKYGDGSKSDVTGYRTGTTIGLTNHTRVLKAEKSDGKWVVFTTKN